MKIITYPLKLTREEHAIIKLRASASGLSIQKFLKHMALDGSLPKSREAQPNT